MEVCLGGLVMFTLMEKVGSILENGKKFAEPKNML